MLRGRAFRRDRACSQEDGGAPGVNTQGPSPSRSLSQPKQDVIPHGMGGSCHRGGSPLWTGGGGKRGGVHMGPAGVATPGRAAPALAPGALAQGWEQLSLWEETTWGHVTTLHRFRRVKQAAFNGLTMGRSDPNQARRLQTSEKGVNDFRDPYGFWQKKPQAETCVVRHGVWFYNLHWFKIFKKLFSMLFQRFIGR